MIYESVGIICFLRCRFSSFDCLILQIMMFSNNYQIFFAGLRKVTDDMKTKNRADRSGAVPAGSAPSEKITDASTAASPKIGTPKCELDGRKYASLRFIRCYF